MKHSLLKLLTVTLVLPAFMGVKADNLRVGNTTRQYQKYVPENLGDKRPLLISMHGMNQDAGYQRGMLNIESVADTAKFVTVFPEGIDRGWDISGTRDIDFVLAIIDEMERLHNIDKYRVYLSGFSMGGMFTYHAMNHIADRIAAFAPFSGYPMGGQPFESSRPVPIIHTHGTTDDVVTYDGVQRSLDGWIARNGCSPTPYVIKGYRYGGCTRYQWGPGDDGAEVVLIERENKGHWIANDYFLGGEEIWNFCKKYTLNPDAPKLKSLTPVVGSNIYAVGAQDGFSVKISAEVESKSSEIESVSFYADNRLLTTLTEAPYEYTWDNVSKGSYLISAKVVDKNGEFIIRTSPFTITGMRNSFSMTSTFKQDVMPDGWIGSNGRTVRVGMGQNCTAGSRCIKFTGSPRDFDLGLYTISSTGGANAGYVAYGDRQSRAGVILTPGTYELIFTTCNYNVPGCADVRCCVYDNDTNEVLGEVTVTPTTNIGNSPSNPFTGSTKASLTFSTGERNTPASFYFYTADARGADLVISNVSLRKKSSEGIDDIEISGADAAKVMYYDIQGRQLSNPKSGMVIRRTEYTDGSVKVDKVVY